MIRETPLPHLCVAARRLMILTREAALDHLHGKLQGLHRGEQKVDVVWHDDKGVQQVSTSAVLLKMFPEEPRGGFHLKDATAFCADGGDEERARLMRARRNGHAVSLSAATADLGG